MGKIFFVATFSLFFAFNAYPKGGENLTSTSMAKPTNNSASLDPKLPKDTLTTKELSPDEKMRRFEETYKITQSKLEKVKKKRERAERRYKEIKEKEVALQKQATECEEGICSLEFEKIIASESNSNSDINEPISSWVLEWGRFEKLRGLLQKPEIRRRAVFLALGNPGSSLKKISEDFKRDIKVLVESLTEDGSFVFYDGDSALSPWIEEHTQPGKSAAISSKAHPWISPQKTWIIENPFRRLAVISEFSKIVFSPDSLTGLGLFLGREGPKSFFLLDPDGAWPTGKLGKWSHSLDFSNRSNKREKKSTPSRVEQLTKGLSKASEFIQSYPFQTYTSPYSSSLSSRTDSQTISINLGIQYYTFMEPTPLRSLEQLDSNKKTFDTIEELLYQDGFNLTPSDSRKSLIIEEARQNAKNLKTFQMYAPTGAVFFGSAQDKYEFGSLVESAIKKIADAKIPLTTGGGPGLMARANLAVRLKNGFSLAVLHSDDGNTIDHGANLAMHTESYSQRIPLLLNHREIILVAPGGKGTLREIAVALVKLGAESASWQPHIVFLEKDYYEGLFNLVQSLPLPSDLKKRIHIVDSESDVESFLKDYFKSKRNLESTSTEPLVNQSL